MRVIGGRGGCGTVWIPRAFSSEYEAHRSAWRLQFPWIRDPQESSQCNAEGGCRLMLTSRFDMASPVSTPPPLPGCHPRVVAAVRGCARPWVSHTEP